MRKLGVRCESWLINTGVQLRQRGTCWEQRLVGRVLLRLGALFVRVRLGCW